MLFPGLVGCTLIHIFQAGTARPEVDNALGKMTNTHELGVSPAENLNFRCNITVAIRYKST